MVHPTLPPPPYYPAELCQENERKLSPPYGHNKHTFVSPGNKFAAINDLAYSTTTKATETMSPTTS
ncbi:hypothetical protein DSUL_20098 [Desulfovibrionales bacterium]